MTAVPAPRRRQEEDQKLKVILFEILSLKERTKEKIINKNFLDAQ